MESIREFCRKLNMSVSGVSTRNLWKSYRDAVTGFALDGFQPGGSTVIIGAGNLNDIDYKPISDASERVVLADIDTDSITEKIQGDAEITSIDFGCFDEIMNISDPQELLMALRTTVPRVTSGLDSKKFDNILISPFYTQLVLPWVFSSFPELEPESEIIAAALELAGKTINIANKYIRSLTSDSGRICLWTDMLEYAADDPVFRDISANISEKWWMDAFFNQYVEQYGHGLGSYGHMEMEHFLNNSVYRWFIWPFDSNRRLIVKITSGFLKE